MKLRNEPELMFMASSYCSVAERCVHDVRAKLMASGASPDVEKRIIDRLKKDGFIDENRYCRSFVRDKFRLNHWGRIKIGYELRAKRIDADTIAEAIRDEIADDDYEATLMELLKVKKSSVKGQSAQDIFSKLCRFAAGRGFEESLIVRCVKTILHDSDSTETVE
ncbi:MAG: RecX family transcriptional regulator [Tannerella sp.]|jgi:regulatory protein|nr:RecX family transcriptional regulator [Tannerella sp.]